MLVILRVNFDLQAAQGVELVRGNLGRVGHGGAVNGGGAGQRADHADLDRVLSHGGQGQAQRQSQRQEHGENLFHLVYLPTILHPIRERPRMMENIIAAARFERKRLCENWLYLHCFSVKLRTFSGRMMQVAGKRGRAAPFRLSNNPFGEVWRTRRSATSIVATAAGRVRRSFRLTPSGRFATFGGNSPLG